MLGVCSIRWWWQVGLAILALAALFAYQFSRPRSPWQGFCRISDGMHEDEVDKLLGPPWHSQDGGCIGTCGMEPLENFGASKKKTWLVRSEIIEVGFDDTGKVKCKRCSPGLYPPTLRERFDSLLRF
jgi:hypothetical protein